MRINFFTRLSPWKYSRYTERGSLEDVSWFLRDGITGNLSGWTDGELEEWEKRKIVSCKGGNLS